jgi:U3 small nucleolar RNA-associated protein 3
MDGGGGGGRGSKRQRGGEEDEFYTAAKAARASSKAAKREQHQVPQLAPPLPEPTAAGQRKITYEIEKNRGLTPHRCVLGRGGAGGQSRVHHWCCKRALLQTHCCSPAHRSLLPPSHSPLRRKDLKNPRKKHRVKFAQAVVRRKGQVQGVQQAPGKGYGGEATGIKARLAKSTRL